MVKKSLIQKFLLQFSWVFIGNLLFAISQWLVIVVITKNGNEIDLAHYTYALALISPIYMFMTFDLRRVLAVSKAEENQLTIYFINRLIHMTIAFTFIFCLVNLFFNDKRLIIVIILLGILKFIEYLSDIIFGYFQQQSLSDYIGKSQIMRSVIFIIIFILTYNTTENLPITLTLINISMLFRLIFYDFRKSEMNVKIIIKYIIKGNFEFKKLLLINFVLGISLLVNSLIINIPRYYLEVFENIIAVGYFSSIYYILTANSLIIEPVVLVLSPILRNKYNKCKDNLMKFVKKIYLMSMLGFIMLLPILFMFSGVFLKVIYNEAFIQYKIAFNILLLTIPFQLLNSINMLMLVMINKKKMILGIALVNLILSMTIGGAMIYFFGINGASLSILMVRIITFALNYNILKKELNS